MHVSHGLWLVDIEESLQVFVGLTLGACGGGQFDRQRFLEQGQLFFRVLLRQVGDRVFDDGVLDQLVDLVADELDEDVSLLDGPAKLDGTLDLQGHGPRLRPDRDFGHALGLEDPGGNGLDLERAFLDFGTRRLALHC